MSRPVAHSTVKQPSPARSSVSPSSVHSLKNHSSVFNDTVLSNNTLIYEKTLNINIDGKNTEQLNRALDEAKIELETLKQDHIVIANNRTVKRLLDHVKIEGTQNLSHQVKRDIQPGDQDGIGVIVTKYQDELHEKTRENAEVTARLVKFERELYEKSCIHNELKIKISQLAEENLRHKQIYIERHVELRKRAKKFEDAIFKEQRSVENIEIEIRNIELKERTNKEDLKKAERENQSPDVHVEEPVVDNTELIKTLNAKKQERDELKAKVNQDKEQLQAETTKLIKQVKKASEQRGNLQHSRQGVSNKIDDVTLKLESDVELSIDAQVSLHLELKNQLTNLEQERNRYRGEYETLCVAYREQMKEFKFVSSYVTKAKREKKKLEVNNIKHKIEVLQLDTEHLNSKVDQFTKISTERTMIESDSEEENSMASATVEASADSTLSGDISRGLIIGKSKHPPAFSSSGVVHGVAQPSIASPGMLLHSGRPMSSRDRRVRAERNAAQHSTSETTNGGVTTMMSIPDSIQLDSINSQGGVQYQSQISGSTRRSSTFVEHSTSNSSRLRQRNQQFIN